MRIAQVAPLHLAVPPHGYGGTERVIANLTEELVRLGHEVTLFASGDSRTTARLVAPLPKALHFDPDIDATAYHVAMLNEVYARADEFDIIHSHLDYLTLPFIASSTTPPTPTVVTLHGRVDLPEFQYVLRSAPAARYVAISDAQRARLPDINWVGTVHHGVDVDRFPFTPEPGRYLVFVGRISPEKGPERAIRIARMAGIPLKIAAAVNPKDRAYFEEVVRPLLDDPLVEFLGPLDEERKCCLMRDALALLLPITWPEPFGMVYIEALACGTPVLTCPRGAAPELLVDGLTGYLAEEDEALAQAARQVHRISRSECRQHVRRHFTARRMALAYTAIYQQMIRERAAADSRRLAQSVPTPLPWPELRMDGAHAAYATLLDRSQAPLYEARPHERR
jgi:glycosyltransferase involved in cell wall biosynthesis